MSIGMQSGRRRARWASAVIGAALCLACGPSAPAGGVGTSLGPTSGKAEEVAGLTLNVSTQAMGGRASIDIAFSEGRGPDARTAADQAIQEVRRIEGLVNMWSADSALQRWNAAVLEGAEAAPMPRELALLVELGARVHALTEGAYDPTVARALAELGFYGDVLVVESTPGDSLGAGEVGGLGTGMGGVEVLWAGAEKAGDRSPFREHPGLPPDVVVWRELLAAAPLPGSGVPGSVPEAGSGEPAVGGMVEVRAGGRLLDLSALAKGYAAERALLVLQGAGFPSARVDLGGSSVAASGERLPDDAGWPVELPDGGTTRRIWLNGSALSTSGQTSLTIEGAEGAPSHLFDPRTLAPVAHATEQVAVVTRAAWLGDALSTALLVMGAEDGALWCRAHPELVMGWAFYVVGAPVAFEGEL